MISVQFPFPPSLNNLFVNVQGKGRRPAKRYASWQGVAGTEIMAQRVQWAVKRVSGPIEITITLQRDRRRMDLDNGAKAIIDTLVKMNIIDDDKNVEKLTLQWGDVDGALAEIISTPEYAEISRNRISGDSPLFTEVKFNDKN